MQFYEMSEIPYVGEDGAVHLAKNDSVMIKRLTTQKSCYQCKKVFDILIPSVYVYRLKFRGRSRWFCGWNCMCNFRKGREAVDLRRKTSKV